MKELMALFLVVLISIESFGAVVSDNDGSAFITKAEFDSLKNNFQAQIDNYNTSIDAKIDGAIAAYLAGIKTSLKVRVSLDTINDWSFPVWMNTGTNKWNDKASARYACSNPEIYTYQTSLWYDQQVGDSNAWFKAMNKWNEKFSISRTTPDHVREGWSWQKNEIAGEKGAISQVKKSDDTRKIGTQTLTVYDREQIGHGWKLIYWIADQPLVTGYRNGTDPSTPGDYEYGAILGKETGNTNKYISNAKEIRPNQIGATMVAGYNSRYSESSYKTTLPTGNNRTTQYLTNNNVRSWANSGGGEESYLNITEKCKSAQFVWKDYKRDWCFVDDANMPAETSDGFCYKSHLPSNTTIYRLMTVQDVGWTYMHAHHNQSSTQTAGSFTAYSPIVVPYFIAARNSSWTTNGYFSYIPAKQVRYKTKDGDVHYMDEGFYMLKLDQNGGLKFDIKFDSGDNTSNYTTTVSFAKAPFNKDFNNKDLLDAKVGTGELKKTNEIRTGSQVSIEIPDLKKDMAIYMNWTNAGTTDASQICVTSLENLYLNTE